MKNPNYRTKVVRPGHHQSSAGASAAEREPTIAEARRAGLKETAVDTKTWFQPVKRVEKRTKK